MTRLLIAVLGALGVLALDGAMASGKPVELASRVAYAPLVAKLEASGGALARVNHVKESADLDRLESGRRYKFVVDLRGRLAIAPLPADAPSNEYVHPILAGGASVLTAGGIRVERAGGKLQHVVVDQDSKAYCPTKESLAQAVRALTALGLSAAAISTEDRPPQCAPQ